MAELVPGIHGLQIGIVRQLDDDPRQQSRALFDLPLLGAQTDSIWARLGSTCESDSAGDSLQPEVDDAVVVGFMNGDPSQPIILGSLHGSKRKPPQSSGSESRATRLETRGGLKVKLDDQTQAIKLATPQGNKLILSDEENSTTVQDENGNRIELRPDGMVISSASDIHLSAQGRVYVDGAPRNLVSRLFRASGRCFSARSE